ncbi:MAG: MFS transporter [Paracoccaceae bacterium]
MNQVRLLMCAIGVIGANTLALSPIAGNVARSFTGAGATDVLTAAALYGAGTGLSALFLAPQIDRLGRQRALVISMAGLALALGICTAAPTLAWLIGGQILAGVSAGMALPAIYGLSADIAPKGRASETLGKVLTGWTLSLVAGVSLSALLADVLHWRAVYGFLAAASLLLMLVLWRLPAPPRNVAPPIGSPLAALRVRGVWRLLLAAALFMGAFYGSYAYLGTHLSQDLGLSTAQAGLAALIYGVGFGGAAPFGRLIDRHGPLTITPLLFTALLFVYALMAFLAGHAALILGLCLVWGGINHLCVNSLVGQLSDIAPERRGAILGLYGAVSYGAMFAGTASFRPVFEIYGFTGVAIAAWLCICPALAGALYARHAARLLAQP